MHTQTTKVPLPSGSPLNTGLIRQSPALTRHADTTNVATKARFPSPHKGLGVVSSDSCDVLPLGGSNIRTAGSLECCTHSPRLTTTTKKTMTVRALFDYDPALDTGLPGRGLRFNHGDILHVVNATDREWWQARRLLLFGVRPQLGDMSGGTTHLSNSVSETSNTALMTRSPLGIIPSRQRIERRQRARSKRVNFFSEVTVIGSNSQSLPNPSSTTRGATTVNASSHLDHASDVSDSSTPLSTPLSDGRNGDNFLAVTSTLDRLKKTGHTETDGRSCAGSLTRNFLKRFSSRNRGKRNHLLPGPPVSLNMASEADLDNIRSYEVVRSITINLARPLLVFGPLKERVIDSLLQDPKFAACVPHTSRPPRPNERDGVDYHFVASKAQLEEDIKADRFIEIGQFQDHYYATSIDSVRRTLQTGRVCVLDVSLPAIRRLELVGLYPMSILLRPLSVLHLRNIQRRLTEDQAKRCIDVAMRLEADNWQLFSTIITLETIEDAVSAIKHFVLLHGGPVIWVPSGLAHQTSSGDLTSVGSQSSTLPRSSHPLFNSATAITTTTAPSSSSLANAVRSNS